MLLAAILFLAFALRAAGIIWGQAYNPDAGMSDSLRAYEVAVAYLEGDDEAKYLGQPRFRIGSDLPGPAWTLVCVAGLKAGGSIEGVSWLLACANVAAIYFMYRLARETVGADAALVAALLAATAPIAVQSSVVVYNPAIMPLFSTLLFLATWRVSGRDRSRAIFWVMFLPLLMAQFHLFVLFLLPAIGLILWLSNRSLSPRWLAFGLICGLALYGPYVAGEMQNGWTNTRAMFSPAGGGYVPDPGSVVTAPARFLINFWSPPSLYDAEEYRAMCESSLGGVGWVMASNVLSVILALSLMVGVILIARRGLRPWRHPRAMFARSPGIVFLLVLCLSPLAIGLLAGVSVRPRYCLLLLAPIYSLAGASAVNWLARDRGWRIFAVAGATMIGVNIFFLFATYKFQGRHIERAPRFLGSFQHLEEVYQSLRLFAGSARFIEVTDRRPPPPGDDWLERWHRDTALIPRYVVLRERERRVEGDRISETWAFDLMDDEKSGSGDTKSAFSGNGIVLIPARE